MEESHFYFSHPASRIWSTCAEFRISSMAMRLFYFGFASPYSSSSSIGVVGRSTIFYAISVYMPSYIVPLLSYTAAGYGIVQGGRKQ